MRRLRNFITIGAFSLLVLSLPAIASAQWRDDDRDDDRYGRDDDRYGNNNGRYGNTGDRRFTVRNLKNRSRQLEKLIDRELDRGRYDGSRREDHVNDLASRFKDAVHELDSNSRQNVNETNRVLHIGNQLDRAISRSRLSYNVQNLWSQIEYDLQALKNGSGYYNNNRNNRNNRNTRYPRNGNGQNLPSWWPF